MEGPRFKILESLIWLLRHVVPSSGLYVVGAPGIPACRQAGNRDYKIVGLLGIEPSQHAPKACVLPVYDSPI